jgi:hypothetical protein
MDAGIWKLRMEAERIAARHQKPVFYLQFKAPLALARKLYHRHPLVKRLRESVRPMLSEDLGHGLYHSMRVSIESAALIYIELEACQLDHERILRLMLIGELAGLLHDVCRGRQDHAWEGAQAAARMLVEFPLSNDEIQCVCCAIANHEAFAQPIPCQRPWVQVVSDCLYDADKFRWGPDNFTHTVWFMARNQNLTPQQLIARFPWGMNGVARIQETFRSATGRQYGPEILEVGLAIGKDIYHFLVQSYGNDSLARQ